MGIGVLAQRKSQDQGATSSGKPGGTPKHKSFKPLNVSSPKVANPVSTRHYLYEAYKNFFQLARQQEIDSKRRETLRNLPRIMDIPQGTGVGGSSRTRRRSYSERKEGELFSNFLQEDGHYLLLLKNPSNNSCYSNSLCASLLSIGSVQEFLSKYAGNPKIAPLAELSRKRPGEVGDTSSLRSAVTAYSWPNIGRRYDDSQQKDVPEFFGDLVWSLIYLADGSEDTQMKNDLEKLFGLKLNLVFRCAQNPDTCPTWTPLGGEGSFPTHPVAHNNGPFPTLQDCIEEDDMERTNNVGCQTCGGKKFERSEIEVDYEPKVLVIRLNSTAPDGRKLDKPVKVPLQHRPFGGKTYVLCAVTIHVGKFVNRGHYTTAILDPFKETGYILSDSSPPVRLSGSTDIQSHICKGYLFYYEDIDCYSRRREMASPLKKTPTLMGPGGDTVKRDLTKSSHKRQDLIHLLIEKRKILHVKSCPQNHVQSYLKQLEIPYDSKVSVEVLRLTLGKGMREIFQEQVKDARKIESLCDYYHLPKDLFQLAEEKISAPVKRLFEASQESQLSPDDLPLSQDTKLIFINVLHVIEEASVDELRRLYEGFTQKKTKNIDRYKPAVKSAIVLKLIKALTVKELRYILSSDPGIKQNKNDDKIPGQMKELAVANKDVLHKLVNFILEKDMAADGISPSTIVNIKKVDSGNLLRTDIQKFCAHYGVEFDSHRGDERIVKNLKRTMVHRLVTDIEPTGAKTVLKQFKTKPQKDSMVVNQLTNLLMKDSNCLNQFFTYLESQASQSSESPGDQSQDPVPMSVDPSPGANISQDMEEQMAVMGLNDASQTPQLDTNLDKQVDEVDVIVKKLENLDSMPLEDIRQLYTEVTGSQSRNQERWVPAIMSHYVNQLVEQLSVGEAKTILVENARVQPDKNLDRLHAQMRSLASQDQNVVKSIIDLLKSRGKKRTVLELLHCKDLPEHVIWINLIRRIDLTELEQHELSTIHRKIIGKEMSKKQTRVRTLQVLRKKLLDNLVCMLDSDDLKFLIETAGEKAKAKDRLKDQLVNLCTKDDQVLMKVFLDICTYYDKNESPSPSPNEDLQGDHPSQDDVEVDQLMENDETSITAGSMSQQDAEQLLSPSPEDNFFDNLDSLSNDELKRLYYENGGKTKVNPKRQAMLQFVKIRAVETILDSLPTYIMESIPKDYNIQLERPSRLRSTLKRKALDDRTFREDLLELSKNPPVSDFNRTHLRKVQRSFDTLRLIREQRNVGLRSGDYRVIPDGTPQNPLLRAGKKMEEELESMSLEFCNVCKESKLNSNVNPDTGVCRRCANERPTDGQPFKFSPENNLHPGPLPPPLKNLSRVEKAAITPLRTQMTIVKLKGGGARLKGHAISFEQDIASFAKELPRKPDDLGIVYLRTPHSDVELQASRVKLLDALTYLFRNNPHVAKFCQLSHENLSLYPEAFSPVQGIPTIETEPQTEEGDCVVEDLVKELDDNEHHGQTEVGHGQYYESTLNRAIPVQPTEERIREALTTEGEGGQEQQRIVLDFPARSDTPVSEFSEAFYTLAYPYHLPTGAGDLSLPRDGPQPSLKEWVKHLINLAEEDNAANRFAADERFIFHMINLIHRQQALLVGSVFADRVMKDKTVAEVKEALSDPNNPYLKCMVHMSSGIQGTNAHFARLRKEVIASERFMRIFSNNEERYNIFLTLSTPDNHMVHLHELLPGSDQYLNKTVVADLEGRDPDLFIDKKTDFNLRQKALNENGQIVNEFMQIRLKLFLNILTEHLGVMDYSIRAEFQARSAIHFHALLRCHGVSLEDMKVAFKDYFDVEEYREMGQERNWPEDETEKYIEEVLRNGAIRLPSDPVKKAEKKAEVEAAQRNVVDFSVKTMGVSAMNPEANADNWAPPNGPNPHPPANNVLRTTLSAVDKDPSQSLERDYCQIVQRVQLHKCALGKSLYIPYKMHTIK